MSDTPAERDAPAADPTPDPSTRAADTLGERTAPDRNDAKDPGDASPQHTADAAARQEDIKRLQRLPMIATRSGYLDLFLLYGTLHMRRDALRRELTAAPADLQALVRLFALGEAQEASSVATVLGDDLLQSLLRLGVLLRRDGQVQTGGLTLMPILGRFAFVPTPSHNPMAYFGDDVAGLLSRISPPAGGRGLNLHAGPCLTALIAAERCRHIIAVESSPVARACGELNVVMNGLADRVDVLDEETFAERHAGQRFDYVLANAPLLPFPQRLFARPGTALPAEGNLSPTALLVGALPTLLSDGGHAQLVGADLGDSQGPSLAATIEAWTQAHALSAVMTIPCRSDLPPDSRVLESLAWACHSVSGQPMETARERLLVHLQECGYHSLYLFYLTVSHGSRDPGLRVSRFDQWGKGFWFR